MRPPKVHRPKSLQVDQLMALARNWIFLSSCLQ